MIDIFSVKVSVTIVISFYLLFRFIKEQDYVRDEDRVHYYILLSSFSCAIDIDTDYTILSKQCRIRSQEKRRSKIK